MTRQLGSALAAERQRASGDARAAERARIAREIHDAISQHLFGLRMIAAGIRRADPGNQQVRAIERISEEALRDMQALLIELRPASLDGAGSPRPCRRSARPTTTGSASPSTPAWTTSPFPRPSSTPCCASPRRHAPTPSGTATPAGLPCP